MMANVGAMSARILSRPPLPLAGILLALFAGVAMLTACSVTEESVPTAAPAEPPAAESTQPAPVTQITTYAGSGSPKFKGDGGPATDAGFFAPTSVAVDSEGNLLIAADRRIRKVDAGSGTISTIAGTGSSLKMEDGGPALETGFRELRGVAVDSSGNVFIADNVASRIRKVDAITGVITTVAGGGEGDVFEKQFGDGGPATEALVKLPDAVAVDSQGNIYIATDNRIRKVDAATGIITTFAGTGERGVEGDDGPATSAGLAEPASIAVDSHDNVFIGDRDNHRVRKVDGATGIMSTVAGIGKNAERTMAIFRVGSSPLLGSSGSRYVNKVEGAGYSGDGGAAIEAMLSLPSGVAVDREDNVYIAEGVIRVRKVDAATGVITTVVAGEVERTERTGRVMVFTTTLGAIVSVAVNAQGDVFMADYKNNVVHRVSTAQ